MLRRMKDAKLKAAQRLIFDLQERFTILGGLPPSEWIGRELKELAEGIRFTEARSRNQCSDIIEEMIDGDFHTADEIQAYFITARCRCALDTIGTLGTRLDEKNTIIKIPDCVTGKQLARWLLIDNWNQRHDVWLKLTAFSIATGNPFYSG